MLKQRLQWRVAQLPDLVDHLRSLVDAQHKEADRAMCGRGEFTLRPQYARNLVPPPSITPSDSASRLFLLVSFYVPMFTLFFAQVNMYMCNRNFFQLFVPGLIALITA